MTQNSLIILSLDCATTGCSVAVLKDGDVLALDARVMARGQAEVLLPMVKGVLETANLQNADLNAIAVTRGPGAFTGMRIGLSAARAFAMALGVPCIGVTTLEAVAHGISIAERQGQRILAAVESKRADIYVQLFDANFAPLCEPQAADGAAIAALIENDADILTVGDGAVRAQEMVAEHGLKIALSQAPALPDARIVATIAQARYEDALDAPPPAPLYLRPPDAKLPKNQGRARP
ncbi:MAG: tRNA (adenosine(37)-N6)-threonylcarbamoyltransferase complex dimerization subunit type 1 TsaB [Magnetovibrio sp.]|nr:tRNA (adenosine(37)-N6)-threonylcarbamoyltransferase complex dimerization subunit type 1 TsaB [Magnetovibrio sp.]